MRSIPYIKVFLIWLLLGGVLASAQQVNKAEYFFDNDPGAGNGTPITVSTPADSVNITANIPVGALSAGFHKLCIRVYASTTTGASWSIYESRSFYIAPSVFTPTVPGIVAGEYYFDNDPGVGKGTSLPSVANLDSVTVTNNIPVNTTLTSGFHKLIVRTKDQRGIWSIYESRSFYVSPAVFVPTVPGIVAAEYFFDNDPGSGNGTALPSIANLDSITVINNITIGGLSSGFHKLIVRTKDQRGIWSIYEARSFYVSPATLTPTVPGIVAAEYYFDTDPGTGKGNTLPSIANLDSVTVTNNISVTTLSSGFHNLIVRVKDQRGIWNIYNSQNFYIKPTIPVVSVPGIAGIEYFVDKDPGKGKGFGLSTGPVADSVNVTLNLPLSTVPSGFHNLFIRAKNSYGMWSQYEARNFYIRPTTTSPIVEKIVSAEYWFNHTDPGFGKGFQINTGSPADSINITALITATGLLPGKDTLNVRVKTNLGKYSQSVSQPFAICNTAPQANFTSDTVCVGSATHFTNLTNGNNAITTFSWDFKSLSVVNSTFPGSVSYIYPTAGTYTATLTVSNGGVCTTTATGQVLVVASVPPQPGVISGNISVCKGIQTKYSFVKAPNTKYSWNTPTLGTLSTNAGKDTAMVNWTSVGSNDALQVIPSNACGAGLPSTLYVTVVNGLSVNAGSDRTICLGDSIALTASGATTYVWLNTNQTTTSINVKPSGTTGYIVKGSQNNCVGMDTIVVVVTNPPAQPVITQVSDTLVTATVNGASYQWFLGNLQVGTNSNRFVPSYTGTYNVKINIGNCSPPLSAGYNYVLTVTCIPQSIVFDALPDKLVSDPPFAVTATATSGLSVNFAVTSGAAVLLPGNIVSIIGISIVAITATQQGNGSICPATAVTRYFQASQLVNVKSSQNITFSGIANKYIGDPSFVLQAVASSGLPIDFALVSGPATLSGDTVTLSTLTGTIIIKASQPGDATFNPAPDVIQVFNVMTTIPGIVKQPQVITFYPLSNRTVADPPFLLTGASTSGLKVNFVVISGPAYIAGDTVFTTGKGTVSIKAYQSGNTFFNPADSVVQRFDVTDVGCTFLPASPVVTGNTPLCTGDNLYVYASNVPNAIYEWIGPDNFSVNGQNFTISGITTAVAGNYRVIAVVGNCFSAPSYLPIDVRITPQKPVLAIQQGEICMGNTEISVASVYGSYSWFLNGYRIANATTSDYSPGIRGIYYIQVFDSTKTCSSVSDTYNYTQTGNNLPPVISASSNETVLSSSDAAGYRWYIDKRLVIGNNSQEISVLFNGTYKVEAIYADSCKLVSAGYTINKSGLKSILRSGVTVTDSTILWPSAKSTKVEVFPNPADQYFRVSYASDKIDGAKLQCTVMRTDGSFVANKSFETDGTSYYTEFSTGNWAEGVYMLKISDGQTVTWSKVVIY